MFLSDEGPTLETLDFTLHIGSTPTFLYIDLNTAYAARYVKITLNRTFSDAFPVRFERRAFVMILSTCTSCFSVCHVSLYVMFLSTLCFSLRHISLYVMFLSMSCFSLRHVSLYVMFLSTLCFSLRYVSLYVMFLSTSCFSLRGAYASL